MNRNFIYELSDFGQMLVNTLNYCTLKLPMSKYYTPKDWLDFGLHAYAIYKPILDFTLLQAAATPAALPGFI